MPTRFSVFPRSDHLISITYATQKAHICLQLSNTGDPARNEPRDLYDLWYLSTNKYVVLADLAEAVALKMKFRGKELMDVKENFIRKEARLKKLWNARLSAQMATLPEFDEVFRAALRELRQAELLS